MMAALEDLQASRDTLAARIAELAAQAGPNFVTEAGLSVSLATMLADLTKELEAINAAIRALEGPIQEVTIGVGI